MEASLARLNDAPLDDALTLLDGVYEHSPWIAQAALAERPFASLAQLKLALARALRAAGRDRQLALVCAHPELAGRAMAAGTLTASSMQEQTATGLTHCSAEELATLQRLNAEYRSKFGWPFILAVRGPRGTGLTRAAIIATFERRLHAHPDAEFAECLRQIDRIAELRLNDRFGVTPVLGNQVWDWAESLARFSEREGELTVRYLTDAHRACAATLAQWMRECGFDDVGIDAVGNVVGVYHAAGPHPSPLPEGEGANACISEAREEGLCISPLPLGEGRVRASNRAAGSLLAHGHPSGPHPNPPPEGEGVDSATGGTVDPPKRLLTGSHYDTVRNAGKYDGRLGILVPMVCVRELHARGRRLPFGIEVVGFAEEEGQRYPVTFLGSSALIGRFDPAWLDQRDADGVSLREAMQDAGLRSADIPALARDPACYLGFVEMHIEQGPVLDEMNLPLGVVTSINGSVRCLGETIGTASHAGTTPMQQRRDAATAAAELALYVERRAAAEPDIVGTVGLLNVPDGSVNVVPGRCRFSLDLRAATDDRRDALAADVVRELERIAQRRGLRFTLQETLRVAAAPSAPAWQARWERAIDSLGLPAWRMPSGAGHDAMKLHERMPQAMLFVRGGNGGISHNPLESLASDDAELCAQAFQCLLDDLAGEIGPRS